MRVYVRKPEENLNFPNEFKNYNLSVGFLKYLKYSLIQ